MATTFHTGDGPENGLQAIVLTNKRGQREDAQPTASVGFRSQLGEESGYVQLHWTSKDGWSGETRQCENRITLTTRPQPFGGRRWFFICPRTGENARKLYLPSGAYGVSAEGSSRG